MQHPELVTILNEIISQNWSKKDWADHESGDWFQTDHFCGGFEADDSQVDGEFTFSFYDDNKKEWWFSFIYDEVQTLLKSDWEDIKLHDPETFDYSSLEGE